MNPAQIRHWQQTLYAKGYYRGKIDGVWGPRTEQATKQYQGELRAAGLYRGDIDGEVGEQMRAAHRAELMRDPSVRGTAREDWRGFVPVDAAAFAAALPEQARGLAPVFLLLGEFYKLNPLFLCAISKHETAAWTSRAYRERNNAMGVSNPSSVRDMPSLEESVRIAAKSLSRPGGYYSKCRTLADVARVYAPVGAANDPRSLNSYWPGCVAKYWAELEKAIIEKGAA